MFNIDLRDDFLQRTATPLEDIFKSIFCFLCLIFLICLRDTFIPEGRKLRDSRRLCACSNISHCRKRILQLQVLLPPYLGGASICLQEKLLWPYQDKCHSRMNYKMPISLPSTSLESLPHICQTGKMQIFGPSSPICSFFLHGSTFFKVRSTLIE